MKAYTECGVTTAHATEPTKSPNLKDEREEEEEARGRGDQRGMCPVPPQRHRSRPPHQYLSLILSFFLARTNIGEGTPHIKFKEVWG